jgi:hypothetical protein
MPPVFHKRDEDEWSAIPLPPPGEERLVYIV